MLAALELKRVWVRMLCAGGALVKCLGLEWVCDGGVLVCIMLGQFWQKSLVGQRPQRVLELVCARGLGLAGWQDS